VADEIVIFDIDGTLADVSERIHHLNRKPKNWDAFFQGMAQDKAIRSMVRLCNILLLPEFKSFFAQVAMKAIAPRR